MNKQYGWECPKCGAVMAPWKPTCDNCTGTSPKPGDPWKPPISPTCNKEIFVFDGKEIHNDET